MGALLNSQYSIVDSEAMTAFLSGLIPINADTPVLYYHNKEKERRKKVGNPDALLISNIKRGVLF